jgi:hypothetical protein
MLMHKKSAGFNETQSFPNLTKELQIAVTASYPARLKLYFLSIA